MIITHHPMIFEGQKKINNHTFTGRRILSLIKHNIQYYAMHTNYDILGMADLSADYMRLAEPCCSFRDRGDEGEVQDGFGQCRGTASQRCLCGNVRRTCEEVHCL